MMTMKMKMNMKLKVNTILASNLFRGSVSKKFTRVMTTDYLKMFSDKSNNKNRNLNNLYKYNSNKVNFCTSDKNLSDKQKEVKEDGHIQNEHEHQLHINYSNIPGVKSGDSSHYIIQFTCMKCEFRTTRMFTKRSYHHGIVLIKCEGCTGVHLIADNLGWFEDSSVNIEDIIKRKGEQYKKLSVEGLFQLSTKDAFEEQKNDKL